MDLALVDQVSRLPAAQAFRVYAELLVQAPHQAQIAALALRDKARAGDLGEQVIPLLDSCLKDAPDGACVVHFAKALAAFGRKAQPAAPTLIAKLREIRVTDDAAYWVLDGGLFALGFLGGKAAFSFLAELAVERPSRATRSNAVYAGELTKEQREQRFRECLERVHDLIKQDDAGVWRDKRTKLVPVAASSTSNAPKKKSWNVR